MSDLQLSSATRALLDVAKADAPSAGTRGRIWVGVANVAGVGVVAGTSSIAAGTSASASKLVAIGAVLGSVVTVGITLAVLRMMGPLWGRPVLGPSPMEDRPFATLIEPTPAPVALGGRLSPIASSAEGVAAAGGTEEHAAGSGVVDGEKLAKPAVRSAPIEAVEEDPLMREAALVAEARGSLRRTDALGALRTVRAARLLSSHGLRPEELSIESRALRALGREAEAEAVDVELKSSYPDHALSR